MTRLASSLIAFLLAFTPQSWGWGPQAIRNIVSGAARLMDKEYGIPLTNLLQEIQAGGSLSQALVEGLIPTAGHDPITAIESEMYLLQAVRGDRVDPYLAYRLGVLGKLTAQLSSPVSEARSTYRTLYDADAEKHITCLLYTSDAADE